jgi:CheY-like chemotaxis protein
MTSVLVIDDDPMVRYTVLAILRRAGYEVHLAEDGLKGLKTFRSRRPDLVITDIVMPVKEGLDTIRLIREWRPDTKIIAFSGGSRLGNKDLLGQATQLGATRVILKPFEPQELLAAVAACLTSSPATPVPH